MKKQNNSIRKTLLVARRPSLVIELLRATSPGRQVTSFGRRATSDGSPRYQEPGTPLWKGCAIILLTIFVSSSIFGAYSAIQTPEDRILAKGFNAFMDGRDKKALSYFEEVIRINPHNKAALEGLKKTKIRLKKIEETSVAKANALAKAKVREGREMGKSGDLVGAIDSYHQAMDAVPNYKAAKKEVKRIRKNMSKVLKRKKFNLTLWAMARGILAYLDRDWAKAYRIWSERLEVEPDNVALANATARAENNFNRSMVSEREEFFRRSARAFYEQGLYQQAKESWEQVVAMMPDDQEAFEGRARSEQAILQIQGKGKNTKVHDLLENGLKQYANQDWDKARITFKKLLQIDPNFSTAKEYIASINNQMASKSYQPTLAKADRTWKRERSSNMGGKSVQIPDKLENFPESISELKSQLKRDPSNVMIQKKLTDFIRMQTEEAERIYKDGLIYYSQGNRSMAVNKWKQVLVINPEHKKAAMALRKARAEEERLEP